MFSLVSQARQPTPETAPDALIVRHNSNTGSVFLHSRFLAEKEREKTERNNKTMKRKQNNYTAYADGKPTLSGFMKWILHQPWPIATNIW